MPARRAIASVDAPCRPCRANSSRAAARISSRRSSAVLRVLAVAVMARKLALTHKSCQGFRNSVEIRLRQLRVERQRERALEASRCAGVIALVAVGAEEVQRVRPDLRL